VEYDIRDVPGKDVPIGKFTTNFSRGSYQFADLPGFLESLKDFLPPFLEHHSKGKWLFSSNCRISILLIL
jgi:hypothetical protein